jgi:hypothetical protein
LLVPLAILPGAFQIEEFFIVLRRNPAASASKSLVIRCCSGDFHTPQKKSAFFQPFLRFFLAFCVSLGYSPIRPEFFRREMG